jgi:hypothetical protein
LAGMSFRGAPISPCDEESAIPPADPSGPAHQESLGMTSFLHNMSVPPLSRVSVERRALPGLRLDVGLAWHLSRTRVGFRGRLHRGGWRAVWDILDSLGQAPARRPGARPHRETLEQHLVRALEQAGVPGRVGVFLDEGIGDHSCPVLPVPAALAVLARRSGPLYLPSRRLECSLIDPEPFVLFFPEETR